MIELGARSKRQFALPQVYRPMEQPAPDSNDWKFQDIMKQANILTLEGEKYEVTQNDFEHLGELGNGTCGHVVKMKHHTSGKVMAVKQMRRSGNREENKRVTMDLAVVLKCGDCPHIVHCYGCLITESDVWICMELMGTCMDRLLRRLREPFPESILGKMAVGTVKALHYLKEKHGVMHRDVKPSNILLDEQGIIKLCDFSISGRLVDSKARTRSAGCAAYLAPERINPPNPEKPDYDIRADVWSLGISLVELATGHFPYRGASTEFEVMTRVLEEDPPQLPAHFSYHFRDFVATCLTKDFRFRPKYNKLLLSPSLHTDSPPCTTSEEALNLYITPSLFCFAMIELGARSKRQFALPQVYRPMEQPAPDSNDWKFQDIMKQANILTLEGETGSTTQWQADLAPKEMATSDMRNRRHVQLLLTWSTNATHPKYEVTQNDFEHLGELGNGTCGHVVKMKHHTSGKVMAVKQMRRSGNREENKRVTMDLAVVLKCGDCPHIVHCYGCLITESDVWICMELMGTCMDRLLRRLREPFPESILGKMAVGTVKALHYLKEKHGVMHRDVKPSNILLDEQGIIKLCDFSISGRLVDSKARTRSAGCAAYLAPERINPPNPEKPDYDIRADVWSLGISLVELATGHFPYRGASTEFEVMTRVLEEDPPQLPAHFSYHFRDFVATCLTKDFRFRPKYNKLLLSPSLHTDSPPCTTSEEALNLYITPSLFCCPVCSPFLLLHRLLLVPYHQATPTERAWMPLACQKTMAAIPHSHLVDWLK
ncbi:MAP2K7 [Cordylochernes scorpioides]|uniref:mitogen-activated protein kinase kinase n=1 Tax=Cordylochernes scorpioides TaxID=51811 RepID=A0ABY6L458_9ARAC|nr:MAP2K7 [Cordylochernes scorpioides]